MSRLSDFINKDTKYKNESKRMTVTIRWLLIFFEVLSFCNLIINILFLKSPQGIALWCVMILVDALNLYATYTARKKLVTNLFLAQKVIWAVIATILYGWDGGFQYYLVLLVLIYSFIGAGYNRKKLIFGFINFVIYVIFLVFVKGKGSIISIENMDRTIEILNTVAFSISVAMLAFVFSLENQAMEDKLIAYNNQLREQASVDALTGLFNRRMTLEYAKGAIDEKRTMSVCMCDIDFFKRVNDTYGHDFGDAVLVKIADILKKMTASYGVVSRWGGEEFLILFHDMNGDEAYVKLHELSEEIKKMRIKYDDTTEVGVTLTYGLTEYDLMSSFEDNVKEADEKLYIGKQNGRNQIVY